MSSTTLNQEQEFWVETLLSSMSLPDLAGQVLLAAFFRSPMSDARALVAAGRVGGILPTGREMPDPDEAQRAIAAMQDLAPVPLLVAADFEAGAASMVRSGATRLPSARAQASQGSPAAAREAVRRAAYVTASEALALGVNLNFAPVADVASHPNNPIVNQRSFGGDAPLVAELVAEHVTTAQRLGLACTAKHFPGHGSTSSDSHLELPVCTAEQHQLVRRDLLPFRAAIAAGVAAVMTAHVHYVALQPPDERRRKTPASLSPAIVTELLRRRLGFGGLAVTDSLAMQAIQAQYAPGEAAVAALRAGNDLLIVEDHFEATHAAIVAAVDGGNLPAERLYEAARRVLDLKAALGLTRGAIARQEIGACGNAEHAEHALVIARGALTLARGRLEPAQERCRATPRPRVIAFFNAPRDRAHGSPTILGAAFGAGADDVLALYDDSDERARATAAAWIDDARPLVAIVFRKTIAYRREGLALTVPLAALYEKAAARAVALVVQGVPSEPPEWAALPNGAPALVAWSTDAASSIAAAEALLGGQCATTVGSTDRAEAIP